jgi:signal transduction histidine kinase
MRLAAVYGVAAVVGAVAVGCAFSALLRQADNAVRLMRVAQTTDTLARDAVRLAEIAHLYAMEPDRLVREALEARLITVIDAVRGGDLSQVDRRRAVEIHALARQIRVQIGVVRAEPRAAAPAGAPRPDGPCLHCRLLARVGDLADAIQMAGNPVFAEIERETARNFDITLTAGAALAVALGVITIYINQTVLAPLERLRAALRRVGEGDLSARVDPRADNEIGEIARSFNAMTENLSQLTANRADLEGEIDSRRAAEAELRAFNARLAEANAELDRIAYIASHDLRAPLRAIGNIAEWLEEDLAAHASSESVRLFGLLRNRVTRLDALLDALLTYHGIGNRPHAPEPVALEPLLAQIAAALAPPSGFEVRYVGAPIVLDADRRALELVITHLVGNALKHHDRVSGLVELRAFLDGDVCRIAVVDDGPGVPGALRHRIFEMFQTLRPRDEVEGSGMGLALARKAVRLNGHDLTVESPVAGGRGAAFAFAWPVRAAVASAAPWPAPEPASAPAPAVSPA